MGASGAEEIQRNWISLWPLPTGPSLMPLVIHPEWTRSPGSSEDSPESWDVELWRLELWGSEAGPGSEAGTGGFALQTVGCLAEAADIRGHTSLSHLAISDPRS